MTVWREYEFDPVGSTNFHENIPLSHFSDVQECTNFSSPILDALGTQHGYYRVCVSTISVQITNCQNYSMFASSYVQEDRDRDRRHLETRLLVLPSVMFPVDQYNVQVFHHGVSDQEKGRLRYVPLCDWRWASPPQIAFFGQSLYSRKGLKGSRLTIRITSEIEVIGGPREKIVRDSAHDMEDDIMRMCGMTLTDTL